MEPETNEILDRKNLLEHMLELTRTGRSGILSVLAGDSHSHFEFTDGDLTAVHWDSEGPSFLLSLFEHSGVIPEKVLRKATKRAQSRAVPFPTALAQEGGPAPERLLETTATAIQEELWRLAGWDGVWWQFHDEPPADVAFDPLFTELQFRMNIEFVVVDIAGRESNWHILDQVFPARLEVLVSRAECARYFQAGPGEFEDEQKILVLMEGERDVDEVLRDSPLDPFETLKVLHRFKVFGEARELNPAELIHLATIFKAKGRFDKCLRLYLRAEHLGNEAFDLDLTIGNIYETIGQEEEALDRYLSFAEKCLKAGERKSGKEAFRRAVELRPSNIEIREKLLQMLDPVEDRKQYGKDLRALLGLAKSSQDQERTRAALYQLITSGLAEADDVRDYIAFLTRERGPREAFQDLYRIGQQLVDEARNDEAMAILESAAGLRPDNLEVQEALGRTYSALGRDDRAAETLSRVAALVTGSDLTDEARHGRLHNTYAELLKLDPEHVDALRYMARHAQKHGDRATSAGHLKKLLAIYTKQKQDARRGFVLGRLIKLEPDNADLRVEYAEWQLASGRIFKGARSLGKAAGMLAEREETRSRAESLFQRVLEHVPFDRVARRELARLYEARGDDDSAREQWEHLADVCLAARQPFQAAEVLDHLIERYPQEIDYVRRATRAYLGLLPERGAVDRLEKALERLVEAEDVGYAHWVVQASGDIGRLKKVLAGASSPRRDLSTEARLSRQRLLRRHRRLRVRRILATVKDRLHEAERRIEELSRKRIEAECRIEAAERNREDADRKRRDVERKLEQTATIEASARAEADDCAGLDNSPVVRKMESSLNLPTSIRDITKKLKGLK